MSEPANTLGGAPLAAAHADLPRVSVVVVTCNGAADLPLLIEALRSQTISGRVPYEIVIIDNNSTDSTADIVRRLAGDPGLPVVYGFEGRQGKAHGLNTGVCLARAPVLAFTDDDGIPAHDWLESILSYLGEHHDVDCIGGRVELYDPRDAGVTVRLSHQPITLDATTFPICNVPIIGCNLAVRRDALVGVGGFDTTVGPGSRIGSGDDLDMVYRLLRVGCGVEYVPRLLVKHNHGRRDIHDVTQVTRRYVMGRGAFYLKYALHGDSWIARSAYWEVAGLLKNWIRGGLFTRHAIDSLRTVGLLAVGAVRFLRFGQRPVQSTMGS